MTTYRYGLRNVYRPSQLSPSAYGWSSAPSYSRADIPTRLMDQPTGITQEQFLQQFAYEWYQSGTLGGSLNGEGFSNPPFVSGAAGRLHPGIETKTGVPARILRGFIRRAQYDTEPMSRARLYFMWNPETITRDYVSYLDQSALDPFNTVYQSGNLVAPPSVLDFSFELFFDRQEEATQEDHPGVYVDYQFFDMVVRNVVPSDPNQASNTLPDNGVMMVNPRDITVVFSPQFTVQGRPLNARVSFEKFTHRMVPTRMRIQLTMRAVYMGPIKDMTEYKAEQFQAEAAIPIDEILVRDTIWNMDQLVGARAAAREALDVIKNMFQDLFGGGGEGSGNPAVDNVIDQTGMAANGNSSARQAALQWARANVIEHVTRYDDTGAARVNLPKSADCSGLVCQAYRAIGLADEMNWQDNPGTDLMISRLRANNWKMAEQISIEQCRAGALRYGDLLLRSGHIRFFEAYEGNNIRVFEAASRKASPQVGSRSYSASDVLDSRYVGVRPKPLGSDMSVNAVNNASSSTATRAV